MKIKDWLDDNRGECSEAGYIITKGVKASGSTSCGMTQSVYGFLVYHAAVGQRVLPEHFNFQAGCVENVINVEAEPWEYQLCRKVIEMFSRPGDWVLDINLPKVTGIAAALSTDRNGLCLVKNEEERQTAREILSELV